MFTEKRVQYDDVFSSFLFPCLPVRLLVTNGGYACFCDIIILLPLLSALPV